MQRSNGLYTFLDTWLDVYQFFLDQISTLQQDKSQPIADQIHFTGDQVKRLDLVVTHQAPLQAEKN